MATLLVAAFDGLKATAAVVGPSDDSSAQGWLAEGGALLEQMLLQALGLSAR